MRQFDIVTLADDTHALLLQADLLDRFDWRVVAPLVPAKSFHPTAELHLPVRIGRRDYFVVVDKLEAIQLKSIRSVVETMRERERDIRHALELVFVGV